MAHKWTDQDGRTYPLRVDAVHEAQSSSRGTVRAYLLNRAKPHLPPWVGLAGTGLAGALGNWRWEGSAPAGVGLTLASVALTGVTWWAGKSTSQQRRLHSAVTVAAGSAWVTAACLAGPTAGPVDDLFLMGGPALALSWNVRMVLRHTPEGAAAGNGDGGLLEKVGLARAQIGAAKVEPNRVTAPLAVVAGEQTNDDVTKALARIASALDLPTSAVRYTPDAGSSRRGELVIVPEDMLADTVEWEGPSNLGGSIAEPLVIGRYDDGAPLVVWLPGDPDAGRNSTHVLVAGGTGSGKGDTALNLLTEVLSRRDVLVWFSDPKAFQDFAPLRAGLDWSAEGGTDTEVMVEAVKAVIPARTRWLGAHGYRQWVPAAAEQQNDPAHSCQSGRACGCEGMPFLVAWFEEAANTLRALGDDAFTGIAQEARSAGISLIVSLQRPSYDQMSTSTRASLPSVIALGCDPRDEGFCLPDTVLDAGAHPGAWGNRRPGYCYVVSPGIDEDRYPSPGRTRRFTLRAVPVMEQLAAWAQRNGASADPVTAGAAAGVAGRAYTGRTPDTAGTAPQPAALRAVTEEDDDMNAYGGGLLVDPEDAGIDPDAELPELQDGDDAPIFGQEQGRKPSPEEARRLFADALADFEAAGQMIVGPKDFMDWCDRHRLSRPWVSERLKEAAMDGRLEATNTTGRWRIVPALTAA
ncbi:plasmid transfer protein TraB [Streptomyces sp. ME18-1-4]|uniref:plasmid transfer protein TraB n=1 Tax=Streptomyces sp. ME18-1-4 TaxID=3028685 RepID=UPI0029B510C6|nr:plasmid transfer protein TraB [Streptomyces sp. ME18-1-4]MDX3243590.1 plasmid transfer protein TraB [Streptomyces sp. ME18-1-4]